MAARRWGVIDNSRAVDRCGEYVAQIQGSVRQMKLNFGPDFHGASRALRDGEGAHQRAGTISPPFIEEPVLAEQAEYYPKLAEQTPDSHWRRANDVLAL